MPLPPEKTAAASPSRRPFQFSLGGLLLLTLVAGLLAAWRFVGFWTVPVVVAATALAFPAWRRPRWLFTYLLPVVWTAVAAANYEHPGDEYGSFGAGSLAGLWIIYLLPNWRLVHLLPFILAAGAVVMSALGLALDWVRVRWGLFAILWLGAAVALFLLSFSAYPTVERALAKNGSYAAYILPAINFGMYTACLLLLPTTAVYRAFVWFLARQGKLSELSGENSEA